MQNKNTREFVGWCIEAHDLAASKLVAFREKDLEFVRVLVVEKMVAPRKLITRIRRLPISEMSTGRLMRWVHKTVQSST